MIWRRFRSPDPEPDWLVLAVAASLALFVLCRCTPAPRASLAVFPVVLTLEANHD